MTSRPMVVETMDGSGSKDFFLQYLKERYKSEVKTQSFENRGFLAWVPDGSLISPVPPECLPERFENEVQKLGTMSSNKYAQMVQEYLNRCGNLLSADASGGLMGLIDFAMTSYPFLENSKIKSFVFKTRDGRSVNGYIGVKDQTPRPWVIYKCGVFCSAEEDAASIKNYMIHFFDQSPFNVIILGNRTGEDYITSNKVFNFGGYFESHDFVDVAHWLREESPYVHLVSSVHIVAVSLGGSAAYLTEARISSRNNQQSALAQSVTSLCAVSDLRPTVDNMYGNSIKGFIFSRLTWKHLQSVRPALSGADDLLKAEPASEQYPNLLGRLATRYMVANDSETLPDDESEREATFWKKNHYSNYDHSSRVPLFVWASEDDSVVDYNINTGNLLRSSLRKDDTNVGIVGVPKGEHCGFATAYGYKTTSVILRNFILMNSPEFAQNIAQTRLPLEVNLASMIEGERIISYWWKLGRKGTSTIELNMEIYGADNSLCPEKWAYHGAENCRRIAKIEFKDDFMSSYGFAKPTNLIEREALVRELNAVLTPQLHDQTIVGQNQWPDNLTFRFH